MAAAPFESIFKHSYLVDIAMPLPYQFSAGFEANGSVIIIAGVAWLPNGLSP